MLIKLALGNVRRSARDFSIYILTLALAACLLYAYLASGEYLLALDLTTAQRLAFAQAGDVLVAFSVFTDVIFCFLLSYANAFLFRRRRRELGMYLLLGMSPRYVASVLLLECAITGAGALLAGLVLGYALSPLFGLVAAYVFGVAWRPAFVFALTPALQCAMSFAAVSVIAALAAVRRVGRLPLVELMRGARPPERLRATGAGSLRAQKIGAAVLLAVVWGTCLLNPGYFIVFIVPMGFIALGGTYLVIRVLAVRVPARLRTVPERYWTGLVPVTVRQLEARAASGSLAAAAECVLIAAGMCLIAVGLAFSAGMRAAGVSDAQMLAPIAYACVFYGAAFLVAAAAVLALQQLAQMADGVRVWRTLGVTGASRALMLGSMRLQVGVCFLVPTALACVHCTFGFTLIGLIAYMMGAQGFIALAWGTTVFTVGVLGLYGALTARACTRAMRLRALV